MCRYARKAHKNKLHTDLPSLFPELAATETKLSLRKDRRKMFRSRSAVSSGLSSVSISAEQIRTTAEVANNHLPPFPVGNTSLPIIKPISLSLYFYQTPSYP
ncbi:hypothetical protein XENOCAPTIV_004069 [Xenoophorus captivus]|uniref:Uncharacterized protein n=1 Tax=Xenoophorus captivus TaxID=1517983 RepID=A0ABV0QZI3_9TELE